MTRLQAALDYRGMKYMDLQWAARIPERNIRRWAQGQNEPKLKDIAPLCRGLEISADWLVGLTDEIEPGVIYTEEITPVVATAPAEAEDGEPLWEEEPKPSRRRRRKAG